MTCARKFRPRLSNWNSINRALQLLPAPRLRVSRRFPLIRPQIRIHQIDTVCGCIIPSTYKTHTRNFRIPPIRSSRRSVKSKRIQRLNPITQQKPLQNSRCNCPQENTKLKWKKLQLHSLDQKVEPRIFKQKHQI